MSMHQDEIGQMQERAWILQLAKEFQDVCTYYQVRLPLPYFRIGRGTQHFGSWNEITRTLQLSRPLIETQSWDVVLEILKHEMAHMWVSEQGFSARDEPHGPHFQDACRRLGVAPWARTAAVEIDPDTARSQHRNLSGEQERQLRRIEKLLSLAQSSNSHEAELAMERARRLAQDYQMEIWQAKRQQTYTYVLIEHGKKTSPAHQNALASLICSHFYVDCVARSQYDAKSRTSFKVLEILGTLENVAVAEYVYWFLWHQLPLLWASYKEQGQKTRASQRSYYLGVINGLHEKLDREKFRTAAAAADASSSLALTADAAGRLERAAQRELQSFIKERYPRLSRHSKKQGGLERDAFTSGQKTGRTLEIRQGLTRQTRVLALASGRK